MPLPPVPVFKPLANPKAIITAPNIRFTVLTDRLIRLEYSQDNISEDRPSQVFWYRDQPVPKFNQTVTDRVIEIETDYLKLVYKPTPAGFTRDTLSITLKQRAVTWHYGDAPGKAENLKGTARTLDMAAGATKLDPGLVSKKGWAIVDDSQTLVFDERGWLVQRENPLNTPSSRNKKEIFASLRGLRGQQDLYFFGYGHDIPALLRDYTRVAGRIPMIPRYILGNWWSRYYEYTQPALQALMEDFRAHEIPLSVCIVDMDWHITNTGNTSNGWTGYTWNKALFPDPQGFIDWLHSQGLRTALNLHPASGVHPHEAQYEALAKWMGIDPASKQPIPFDISDPRFMEGYFELLHHPQEQNNLTAKAAERAKEKQKENLGVLGELGGSEEKNTGVDFWWMDWQQGKKSKVAGLDPLWGLNHLHFQDLGRDGRKRPFVFSRWGGLGNHRYPIGFSGDSVIMWPSLAFQPYFTSTAANVAYGWWSHDIGGHMFKDRTPELYLRWVQFGVFSPILRLHSTKQPGLDRRPWGKPERIFHAARDAMQLRHALIPYIYSMAWRAHQTGLSLVTPMYYGNMDSADAHAAKDQYYFGTELMAAPVIKAVNTRSGFAAQKVWFPAGTWFNFFDGSALEGDRWHTIKSTLEDIPVFARAGAIVPLAPKVGWGGLDNPRELDVYIFPGADNRFELYEDDGETVEYQNGKYAVTVMESKVFARHTESARLLTDRSQETSESTFTIHPAAGDTSLIPAQRTYRIHLRGVGENTSASLPGKYDSQTHMFSLEPFTLAPHETRTIEFHPSSF